MAKARVIIKRRKAVRNIRKITKVMQMIATAQYQKAYRRAVGTKPYVKKMGELVASVMQAVKAGGDDIQLPLMTGNPRPANKVAVLVISSNRGLAGGYNGNILRLATHTLKSPELEGKAIDLYVSGKKGIAYFKFAKRPMADSFTSLGDKPKYAEIEKLGDRFIKDFIEGKIDALKIVYMQFLSAGQQKAAVMDLLPLSGLADKDLPAAPGAVPGSPKGSAPYDFAPAPEELLASLLPATAKITLFQAFIEASVSEQIARMVAMKAATDNADKLTKRLTQQYNRARQSQITGELSELMGGVEAMK